jgi:4'-phosphopantetheinyl transferase
MPALITSFRLDDTNVWAVPMDDPPAPYEELRCLLSTSERKRAARFRFEEDERRYSVARSTLRILLGAALGRAPGDLEFSMGIHGKPALEPAGFEDLQFNVSHAGRWILIGLSQDGRIGVDVERLRPMADLEGIAARFFAPGEIGVMSALPEEERLDAFFTCWTRKEAFIKADGTGLSLSLDSFEVTVRPGEPPALLTLSGSRHLAARWSLWAASPQTGYLAAAAIEAPGVEVASWYWTGSSGVRPWTAAAPAPAR